MDLAPGNHSDEDDKNLDARLPMKRELAFSKTPGPGK